MLKALCGHGARHVIILESMCVHDVKVRDYYILMMALLLNAIFVKELNIRCAIVVKEIVGGTQKI